MKRQPRPRAATRARTPLAAGTHATRSFTSTSCVAFRRTPQHRLTTIRHPSASREQHQTPHPPACVRASVCATVCGHNFYNVDVYVYANNQIRSNHISRRCPPQQPKLWQLERASRLAESERVYVYVRIRAACTAIILTPCMQHRRCRRRQSHQQCARTVRVCSLFSVNDISEYYNNIMYGIRFPLFTALTKHSALYVCYIYCI